MKPIRNSAKAVIIKDNRLLALKCILDNSLFYQLPGGGQLNGETLTKALKRECQEEISADVVVGDLLFLREYIGGWHGPDWHQVEFYFSCKLADGAKCAPGTEPDKVQIDIVWLPLDKLDQYPMRPNVLISRLMRNKWSRCVYLGNVD